MAFGLKGYLEHPSTADEADTHRQPVLPPVCWPVGEINLPKSSPRKQVLVLVDSGPGGAAAGSVHSQRGGCWGCACRDLLPAGRRGSASMAGPHLGAAGAWAPLGEVKVQPSAGSARQLRFPPAGPAASLAAWLGAIYTSLHGHFTAQKGLVEKLRK